jgi:RNA polymerase sigma factor (sigma-70 family)
VPEESLNAWFKREILVHEDALLRYLMRAWPRRDEVDDLRQETFARVYEAAMVAIPHSARSFLFTTAHHLMTDKIRRERVVSIEATGDIEALNVLVDEVSPEQRVSARQDLKRLSMAFDRLPPRCREVIWMRRVLDLPQKEVARRLGVHEKAVEKQVAKGSRLIVEYMNSGDRPPANPAGGRVDSEKDGEHGKRSED